MSNIIYFSEHLNTFNHIQPMITEVCRAAGLNKKMTESVISEYRTYFQQLSSLPNDSNSSEVLNHACHIILGLLIQSRLKP